MNQKNEYSQMRSAFGGDDLQDSNEQELEKVGFFHRIRRKECATSKASHALPVEQPQQKNLTEVGNRAIQPTERKKPKATKTNEKEETVEQNHRFPVYWGISLIGSLLVSLIILGVTLTAGNAYLHKMTERTEAPSPTPPSDSMTDHWSTAEEKVIFVKQYDDTSGILTTPELYARCAKTVVSVLTKKENATGIGSGFILSQDGYIATAYHVVEGMSDLTVRLSDQTAYPATLIHGDSLTDLAVLKIEATNLPTVEFGSSGKLLVGEKVIAIGTPASVDYAGSLCSGEVSYLARTVKIYDHGGNLQKKMTLLQTSAPVNPGNSGCPLFDEYGRVVGIITMKLGTDYAGIGFAIPSDGALPILKAILDGKELTDELRAEVSTVAPRLGIVGESDDENGMMGVRILRFSDGINSSAFALKIGDLIVQIDEQKIQSVKDVSKAIQSKNPGDSVKISVLRADQQLTFEVILGKSNN